MSIPTGDDTARLGYRPESEASLIARKAMRLLPAAAVLAALREMRPLTDAEVDALLAVEETTAAARALVRGLLVRGLLTADALMAAADRWSSLLGGEAGNA